MDTPVVPGLTLYRLPDHKHPTSPHRWRIEHHTGSPVVDAMRREDAIKGLELLGTLGDWTQDADTLRSALDAGRLFGQLSQVHCIPPASEKLAPGAAGYRNGRYTDDDIRETAAEFKADGYNALEVLVAMAHRVPWMGLDTEDFNEVHDRIVQLAGAN